MNANTRLMFLLLAFAASMLGVAYAFVPLYKLFCQTFGIPLPSVAVDERLAAPKPVGTISNRTITVRFLGGSDATMPVQLRPATFSRTVRLGEPVLTAYHANNTAANEVHGVAVHMLYAMGGPDGVNLSKYVDLQQCFCFEEQIYPARKDITLPLSFTITPDLPQHIHTISFNYTLFPSHNVPAHMRKDAPKP